MAKIDLGTKYDSPKGAIEAPMPSESAKPKVSYPTLYAHKDGDEGFDGMPEGDFNFKGKGKVVSRGTKERDGKKSHSMEMEVHHIEHDGVAKKASKGGDAGEGLQKELEKIEKRKTKPSRETNETAE